MGAARPPPLYFSARSAPLSFAVFLI